MKKALLFLCLFAIAHSIFAGGFIMTGPKDYYWRPNDRITHTPKPFPDGFNPFAIELMNEEANITISDGVASVKISQTFYSPLPDTVQAYFLLPVPLGQDWQELEIKVNNDKYRVENYTPAQSLKVCEEIIRRTGNTAYWQFAQQNIKKVSLYQLPPRQVQHFVITYKHTLNPEAATTYRYEYPVKGQALSPKAARDCAVNINIESTDKEIKWVYQPHLQMPVSRTSGNKVQLNLKKQREAFTQNPEVYFSLSDKEVGYALLTHKTDEDDAGYFMLSLDAGYVDNNQITAKDVTFVIDASQHAAGALANVKAAVGDCIRQLNADDRFNIISFADEANALFESVQPAAANAGKASGFLSGLNAAGNANIEAAIKKTLTSEIEKVRPHMVLFITAGKPSAGETDIDALSELTEDLDLRNVRIYTIGLSETANTILLDRMAQSTLANSSYASSSQIKQNIKNTFQQIGQPVVCNLQYYITNGFDLDMMHPRLFTNIFKGQPLTILGRYDDGGSAAISLTGNGKNDLKRFNYDLPFPEENERNSFIKQIWAARQCGDLLLKLRLVEDNEDWKDEILELAPEQAIVNPYTHRVMLNDQKYSGYEPENPVRAFTESENQKADYGDFEAATGTAAVAASQHLQALYATRLPDEVKQAQADMLYVNDAEKETADVSGEYVYLQGRPFYKTGDNAWWDYALEYKSGKPQRIAIGSEEYYTLATGQPDCLPFLTFAEEITFVLNGRIYQTYIPEETEEE